jgi:hypothetical protein
MFPVVQLRAVEPDEADCLLVKWEHPLGPLRRPFGREDWLREVNGQPIALASSASIVGSCVRRFATGKPAADFIARKDCVELARLARHPDHPRALRAMLRDWTDHLAPLWQDWPASWAVSYAMPGHPGNVYHADGWLNWGRRKASTGGGTWSGPGAVAGIADGHTTLWVYRLGGAA